MDLFGTGRNGQRGSNSVTQLTLVRWNFELGNAQTILVESREAEKGVS